MTECKQGRIHSIETFGTVEEDLSLKNAEKIFENLENKNKNNLISKLFGI